MPLPLQRPLLLRGTNWFKDAPAPVSVADGHADGHGDAANNERLHLKALLPCNLYSTKELTSLLCRDVV
jgi:hypothetical protein